MSLDSTKMCVYKGTIDRSKQRCVTNGLHNECTTSLKA